MGIPYNSYQANRRGRKPVIDETDPRNEASNRRKILYKCYDGLSVRRLERMVSKSNERSPSNETRNCPTTNRIQHVERDNSTVVYQVNSTDDDTVFL